MSTKVNYNDGKDLTDEQKKVIDHFILWWSRDIEEKEGLQDGLKRYDVFIKEIRKPSAQ